MKRKPLQKSLVLTVLLSLMAITATAVAALKLPPHYLAQSDVALLPSVNSSKLYGDNPYLSFNGSLPMTAQIVAYQMMDPLNVQQLKAEGYNQPFAVVVVSTVTSEPILNIQVTGGDKAAVQHTLSGVTNDIFAEVAGLQKGITQRNQITVLPVSSDLTPHLVLSKTARPLVLILGVGLALAFAIPRMMISRKGQVPAASQGQMDWLGKATPHDQGPNRSGISPVGQHAPTFEQQGHWNGRVFSRSDGYVQLDGLGQANGPGRPGYGQPAGYRPSTLGTPSRDHSRGFADPDTASRRAQG